MVYKSIITKGGSTVSAKVFCKREDGGKQSFYLQQDDCVYFLFCQDYRRGNEEFFGRGVRLNEGLDFSGVRNYAVRKTMEKLRVYLRYAEKEYAIAVFEKTKRREQEEKRRIRRKRAKGQTKGYGREEG